MAYTPLTGNKCGCKRGIERDNCPNCEGTGKVINFRAIHANKQSKPAHTPTPWTEGNSCTIRDSESADIIAQANTRLHEWKENRAFTIRAVNSHEELLEKLKWAENKLTEIEVDKYGTISQMTKDIRRSIAKAEGK